MVQSVGSTNPYYAYSPTPPAGYVAPAGSPPPTAYQADAYAGGNYYAPVSMAASGSISAIVSDPSAATRFSLFMINSPERLLKVGGGMGAVGRGFLNLLAGNIPLFTSSAQRAQISNNVKVWISSADLMRTGASAMQSHLLHDIGIWKAQDLMVYQHPGDQAVLAQRMAGAAAARGVPAEAPSAQQVASWVQVANQVTKYDY